MRRTDDDTGASGDRPLQRLRGGAIAGRFDDDDLRRLERARRTAGTAYGVTPPSTAAGNESLASRTVIIRYDGRRRSPPLQRHHRRRAQGRQRGVPSYRMITVRE